MINSSGGSSSVNGMIRSGSQFDALPDLTSNGGGALCQLNKSVNKMDPLGAIEKSLEEHMRPPASSSSCNSPSSSSSSSSFTSNNSPAVATAALTTCITSSLPSTPGSVSTPSMQVSFSYFVASGYWSLLLISKDWITH